MGRSPSTARTYVNRILAYVMGLEAFPKRGSLRDEIRPGLRVIGFERRVSIAFVVEDETQKSCRSPHSLRRARAWSWWDLSVSHNGKSTVPIFWPTLTG